MKPRIIAIVIILLFQNKLLFAQAEPKNPVFWIDWGFTKIIWKTKYLAGVNYQFKPNHLIGLSFYQFGELEEGVLFFGDEVPNRIKESATFKLSYGYQINPKNNYLKIIPSIGIGQTFGLYRTDKLIPNTSSGSPWFNFSSKDYEEVSFSGVSISPQIDFILHHKWIGFGLVVININTFEPSGYFLDHWKTYSSMDFAFKICIGNFRK